MLIKIILTIMINWSHWWHFDHDQDYKVYFDHTDDNDHFDYDQEYKAALSKLTFRCIIDSLLSDRKSVQIWISNASLI